MTALIANTKEDFVKDGHYQLTPVLFAALQEGYLAEDNRAIRFTMNTPFSGHYLRFGERNINISVHRHQIEKEIWEVHNLSETLSHLDETSLDSQRVDDYLHDMALDCGYDVKTDGLLLDHNDDNPLYLNRHGSKMSKHVDEENNVIAFHGAIYFDIRGEKYRDFSVLKDVDLSKFRRRHYDIPENWDYSDSCTDYPSLVYVINTDKGNPTVLPENEIDAELIISWVRHQITKQVFECTFDPFFEKDGMIHCKSQGHRSLEPEYNVPKGTSLRKWHKSLKICKEYDDRKYWY